MNRGFSLLEMIAAVTVLAVVALATVTTVDPIRERSLQKADARNIARLQDVCNTMYWERGTYPDEDLTDLKQFGYTTIDRHTTPYGGHYTFSAATQRVENRNAPVTKALHAGR